MEGSENGEVLKVGQAETSRLIEVLVTQDRDEQMPPKGARLSPEEITLLKTWVNEGLTWQEGFAFQKPAYEPPLKPRLVTLPVAREGRDHPVDRILDAYLESRQLPRPELADDATFARRAHLDLIGLLPEAQVLQKWLDDKAPDKRARLLRDLLGQDVAYAEHWLTFWNDLLRNDYGGTGFITGGRRQISKWLYESLVTNKPADRFVQELIAPPGDESRGFIDGIQWRGDVSAGQTVEIQFAQSVAQSFLGINMKCASCHDSFVDRWKLDEAYGLAAIYSKRPLDIARCDKPTGRIAKAAWIFPELGRVDEKAPQPERLKQLAKLMTHPENGRFTRTLVNRLWHRLMGRGIVHPVDAMQTEPWSADLLDHLANVLKDSGYDLKKVLEHITTSQAYQSQAQILTPGLDDRGYVYAGPRARRLTAEQFVDALWQLTGTAPAKIDAPVMRGKRDLQEAQGIQISARWIWGDSARQGAPPAGETLTLRKTVTLPSGITRAAAVVTCDNGFHLYVNGRLVTQGSDWSNLEAVPLHTALKEGANIIAAVVKNEGTNPNPAGFFFEARIKLETGAEQVLISDENWEWNVSTPTAKEGRLGALPKHAWKPAVVVPALPVWQSALSQKAPALLAQASQKTVLMTRASLMKSDLLMRSLGRPNREQIVSMRPNDLTTLEAIDLANGALLADTLDRGAKLLMKRSWPNAQSFIDWLYLSALSRGPNSLELSAALEAMNGSITEQSISDLLWAVTMLPEFQIVR